MTPRNPREPARLDADRSAVPKTKIVGHAPSGVCVGPGSNLPLEYVEGDDRTPLQPRLHWSAAELHAWLRGGAS